MADWSKFPQDLSLVILEKLNNVIDSNSFSRVCTSWRIMAQDYLNRYVPTGAPCLMIPATNLHRDTSSQSRRILASPVGANIDEVLSTLPQVRVPHIDLCRGSHLGWLVMIKNNMDMYLFNPFSNRHIHLPSVMNLNKPCPPCKCMSKWYVNKAFLSTSPSENYLNCYVLVLYGYHKELALYRVGDTSWKCLPQLPHGHKSVKDAIYFKDKWLILVDSGEIYTCDPLNTFALIVFNQAMLPHTGSRYLVESRGKLFQIVGFSDETKWFCSEDDIGFKVPSKDYCEEKHLHGIKGSHKSIKFNDDCDERVIDTFDYDNFNGSEYCLGMNACEANGFAVYKLDRENSETNPSWTEVNNLDDGALFLGLTQSFLLPDPQLFGYKRNHIYFTDGHIGMHKKACVSGYDVGTFNMEDESIEPIYKTSILSMRPPAVWLVPKF